MKSIDSALTLGSSKDGNGPKAKDTHNTVPDLRYMELLDQLDNNSTLIPAMGHCRSVDNRRLGIYSGVWKFV